MPMQPGEKTRGVSSLNDRSRNAVKCGQNFSNFLSRKVAQKIRFKVLVNSARKSFVRSEVWMKFEKIVIKSELIRDVALKFNRTANRPPSGEKQMMLPAQINDCANIKRRALVRKVSLIFRLMVNFQACQEIG